jgi:methylmalonyl-CoA mutase cobalamin-binding subunit
MARLFRAVLCPDRDSAEADLGAVMAAGPSPQDLIDRYIPEAARRFGADWASDRRSFAEVTIGVSRLQGWLRALDPARAGGGPPDFDAPEILLVVPAGNQHTLGGMVAMSQFRRLGAMVRLALCPEPAEVGRMVRAHRYGMVAISASGCEPLESLRELTNMIRKWGPPVAPVVIGGPILDAAPQIGARIGADHATSDPREALDICGLTPSTAAGAVPAASRESDRAPPGRSAAAG